MPEFPTFLLNPPRQYSVMPFWFWNDDLDADEIVRQIRDFEAHGVYGFIVHPRMGLPPDLSWMSEKLLLLYDVAIDEAQRRGMYVVLYDEGMYPSGSSAGQVVAANPDFHCRCLARIELTEDVAPQLPAGQNLVSITERADGSPIAVIDRQARSFIRGLHLLDGGGEERPPAADILNPAAVRQFIECVYDVFAERYGAHHFGRTIPAIFTDEPGLLAKCSEANEVAPGTTGILEEVNRILGYDFTPHLPALWYDDEPDAEHFRDEYERAIHTRLDETYYSQLYDWCSEHGIDLTGHPAHSDEMAPLRYFHLPGQDTVWRSVLPDHPSALEGRNSPQAKCTSSAMIHGRRRRNANECCGAYGHELTFEEMTWLGNWCMIRGVNLLFPHAFYYSVRDGRGDERPPDVGPNSDWWDRYGEYADACRRISWLNTDCRHVCHVAILARSYRAGWAAAKVCFQNQIDFNYLDERHLWEDAVVDAEGIHLGSMDYRVVVVEDEPDARAAAAVAVLERAGRVVRFGSWMRDERLIAAIDQRAPRDVTVTPAVPGLRVRHVVREGWHWVMLFNEVAAAAQMVIELCAVDGQMERAILFEPGTAQVHDLPADGRLRLAGHQLQVIGVPPNPPPYSLTV